MAYQINKFNGSILTHIVDGTVDRSTDLALIGKNYSGYGELQNENFLHLLENFSSTSPPPRAVKGQLWYDDNSGKLKYYNGKNFKLPGGAEVSVSAPNYLLPGEFWWNDTTKQLYVRDEVNHTSGPDVYQDYKLVGPVLVAEDASIATDIVNATSGGPYSIIRLMADSTTSAIISSNEFNLSPSTSIAGFDKIKRGITLYGTDESTGSSSFVMHGTSENANRLGTKPASDYLTNKNEKSGYAETFTSSVSLTIGTVVMIDTSPIGDEIVPCVNDKRAIGVVSDENETAVIMTYEPYKTSVVIKGRAKVLVDGDVNKGDYLKGSDVGVAVKHGTLTLKVFAIALEAKSSSTIGLVEALIL